MAYSAYNSQKRPFFNHIVGISGHLTRKRHQFGILQSVVVASICAMSFSVHPARGEFDPVQNVWVRRNIYSLQSNSVDLLAYRKGVASMKALPATNPLSWQFQANIHGTTDTGPLVTNWNKCQHQSFFFTSWHRMYVYYFERIVRAQAGDTNFALPYWNYEIATQRALPSAFRIPAHNLNPLYESRRNSSINSGSSLTPSVTSAAVALSSIPFIGSYTSDPKCFGGVAIPAPRQFNNGNFTGQLELQPHNVIHGTIGGLMGNPLTAGRDPIFWLHHANIDRLWVQWLSQGGGRVNPTTDAWMKTRFTFYDFDGKQVVLTASQILDTGKQLNYIYDMAAGGPNIAIMAEPKAAAAPNANRPLVHLTSSREKGLLLGNRPVTATLPLTSEVKTNLLKIFEAPVRDQKVLLSLEGISFKRSPGVVFEVYLNIPTNEIGLASSSNHLVGNLSFFGFRPEGESGDARPSDNSQVFDATLVVSSLKSKGLWKDDTMQVTFVPGGIEVGKRDQLVIDPDSNPRIEAIRLFRQ